MYRYYFHTYTHKYIHTGSALAQLRAVYSYAHTYIHTYRFGPGLCTYIIFIHTYTHIHIHTGSALAQRGAVYRYYFHSHEAQPISAYIQFHHRQCHDSRCADHCFEVHRSHVETNYAHVCTHVRRYICARHNLSVRTYSFITDSVTTRDVLTIVLKSIAAM